MLVIWAFCIKLEKRSIGCTDRLLEEHVQKNLLVTHALIGQTLFLYVTWARELFVNIENEHTGYCHFHVQGMCHTLFLAIKHVRYVVSVQVLYKCTGWKVGGLVESTLVGKVGTCKWETSPQNRDWHGHETPEKTDQQGTVAKNKWNNFSFSPFCNCFITDIKY